MKRSISLSQLIGFALTSVLGTVLHFLYDWLDESSWVAPFSSINESTWEHMKLLFWPMFIYTIVQSFFFRDRKDFWCIKLRGILLGIILIPTLFYIYNGAIGKSPDWLNISIFFISAAIAYIYEYKLFRSEKIRCKYQTSAIFIICVIALLFIVFTFITPEINIFKDPSTGTFGI